KTISGFHQRFQDKLKLVAPYTVLVAVTYKNFVSTWRWRIKQYPELILEILSPQACGNLLSLLSSREQLPGFRFQRYGLLIFGQRCLRIAEGKKRLRLRRPA